MYTAKSSAVGGRLGVRTLPAASRCWLEGLDGRPLEGSSPEPVSQHQQPLRSPIRRPVSTSWTLLWSPAHEEMAPPHLHIG